MSALRGLEASRLLLLDFALRSGTDTKRGRDALAEHGQTVDRWVRTAKVIGLERRSKQVLSLEEELLRIHQQQPGAARPGDINHAELSRRRGELEVSG